MGGPDGDQKDGLKQETENTTYESVSQDTNQAIFRKPELKLPVYLSKWLYHPYVPNPETQRYVRIMQKKVDPQTFKKMVQQGYDEALRMGYRGASKGTLESRLAEKRLHELIGERNHPAYPTVSIELEKLPKFNQILPNGFEMTVEVMGSLSLQKKETRLLWK